MRARERIADAASEWFQMERSPRTVADHPSTEAAGKVASAVKSAALLLSLPKKTGSSGNLLEPHSPDEIFTR